MKRKVTYKQLRQELERLGWTAEPLELDAAGGVVPTKATIFRNPKSDLFIVLPRMRSDQFVEPIHLLRVRNVLENAGFWDSLVRQTNAESRDESIHVLQTLAGIKTGQ